MALDAMRGATIVAMILVNNPGSWSHVHPQLRHANWHGWTLTDLVFPFFLFIVGVSIVYSLGGALDRGRTPRSQLGRVFNRSLRLLFFGLLIAAWSVPALADIRIPGVLQRISVCYLAGAILYLYLSRRQLRVLLITLLAGYWAALVLIPVPGVGPPDLAQKDVNIAAWLDRLLLEGHLWGQSKTWDPEGILSTLSSIATVLLGLEVGRFLRGQRIDSERVRRLAIVGVGVAISGRVWGVVLPINKSLWTGSFVLWTGGLGMVLLALLLWIIDLHGWRRWAHPFVVFGRNAISVFVMSGLLARTFNRMTIATAAGEMSLKRFYYDKLFTSWLPPDAASLAHALAWVLFCYLVVWVMFRNRIFIRI